MFTNVQVKTKVTGGASYHRGEKASTLRKDMTFCGGGRSWMRAALDSGKQSEKTGQTTNSENKLRKPRSCSRRATRDFPHASGRPARARFSRGRAPCG